MENGSLWDWLHRPTTRKRRKEEELSWACRLRIAIGLAKGVEYLHHDCVPRIVHRDIKSSNVLLDGDMEAHLGDFGLAKAVVEAAGSGGRTESGSLFAGSYGYIAPECAYSTRATERSDVYSMGIVLMELVSGLMPTSHAFGGGGDVDMVSWVESRIGAPAPTCEELLDAALKPLAPHEQSSMFQVLQVALQCTRTAPAERPTSRKVSDRLLHISSTFLRAGDEILSCRRSLLT
ncbi:LRR receptor-like serine/threonine-protein kinase GSO1 [Iris pallida]|uniref:non-specific serine/threonine protein kinase n=1 Tax=Iris pallida TaxID=29817 RepID=A0AAX6G4J2_IRIPA|nr:LRR receptor-like serine/threonine-protein kinase GSO1 [Iris pallida]KAJ6823238.1 LRR receptor-like serine/threonine-protein kinase GSO1 [Iris pallida]